MAGPEGNWMAERTGRKKVGRETGRKACEIQVSWGMRFLIMKNISYRCNCSGKHSENDGGLQEKRFVSLPRGKV